MQFADLAPFIKRLLSSPNESTARRIMGSIGIGATSDSVVEGSTNLFFTVPRARAAVKYATGAGSPEGVVTAPVGWLYTRTDGGAGTTLYVKESGAGNTGWVAK